LEALHITALRVAKYIMPEPEPDCSDDTGRNQQRTAFFLSDFPSS